MAQRRTSSTAKGARKKSKKSKKSTGRSPRIAGVTLELPDSLQEYGHHVRRRLTELEKQAARLRADASRRVTRLVREASHRLGGLEVGGERGWRELTERSRRDLANFLRRLERAVDPGPQRRRSPRRRRSEAGGGRSGAARSAGGTKRPPKKPAAEPGAPPGPGSGPAAPPGRAPTDTSRPPS